MVNDPAKDLASFFDLSTQSETSNASFGEVVLVAYNDSGELFDPFAGIAFTGFSRSTDAGRTFRDMGAIPPPVMGANFGDPAIGVNRKGQFFVAGIAFDPAFGQTIGISRSVDGGVTFLPPASVPTINGFADKDLLDVDNTGGRYDGQVYVTFTLFASPDFAPAIVCSRSVDGGVTFSPPVLVSTPDTANQAAEPVVAPDGSIYVSWLQILPEPAIMVSRSTDGGLSFRQPTRAASVVPIGSGAGSLPGNFRAPNFPRIDVASNGAVFVVFSSNPPSEEDGADIYLVRSNDGGITWSAPLRVNDDATIADQFFPDVAVNKSGVVRVLWYDRRMGATPFQPGRNIDVFTSRSLDGGLTFSPNERVTNESFPPAVGYDPFANPQYMGDYIDIRAGGGPSGRTDTFLLSWGDNRRQIVTQGGVRNDQDVVFTTR